ncbi:phosphatase PAP2 family protein [Thermoflavimicrobium dichotomicum]|uniref:Undecaprenyl-diphosphatase n=1 Tax=Thermoflavimicrobium dichotomicum TaxID=46223 RepID=A0A1I3MLZ0_9BACL|nr:phosphatase PAP2 family protein [Thermoflavimicrobium dichotomicum]SFI97820.1 undecaprenyl-diphosphatase [Thermoflavimicrobium dichotomicum]
MRLKFLSNYWYYLALFGLIMMAFGSLNLFAELSEDLLESELENIDQMVRQMVEHYHSPSLTSFFTVITELGSTGFLTMLTTITVMVLLYKYKRWKEALALIMVVGTCSIFTTVFKHLFQRQRPMEDPLIDATGYSFPSGHSVGSMAFYGFLIYLCLKMRLPHYWKMGISFFLGSVIVLVGFSRIYLEAHYLTDVLAGFSLGFFCLALVILWSELSDWPKKKTAK